MNKDLHKTETITRSELILIIDSLLLAVTKCDNIPINERSNNDIKMRNELHELKICLQRTLMYRDNKINIDI